MEIEVIKYIQEAQKHGLSDMEIKQNLLSAGWEAAVVEESLVHAKAAENKSSANKDEDLKSGHLAEKPAPALAQHQTTVASVGLHTTLSEQHFQQPNKPGLLKRPGFWVALLVLLILGAGGYYAYAYLYISPAKVWNKFILANKSKIYKNAFNFSYTDKYSNSNSTSTASDLKGLAFGLEGSGYSDATDKNNPQADMALKGSISYGGNNISKDVKLRLLNNNLYLNVGQLPSSFADLTGGKQYDWVKVDLGAADEMSQLVSAAGSASALGLNRELQDQLKNKLEDVLSKTKLVKMDKYLGKEKVNDVNTYHFKNSLDKQALAQVVSDAMDVVLDTMQNTPGFEGEKVTPQQKEEFMTGVRAFIDRFEIKEFETWVGTKDLRLYKMHFVSSAPSIAAIFDPSTGADLPVIGVARAKSRDAKRLADLRQFASGLELYYNDHNGYPEAVKGKPEALVPMYLGIMPQVPTPADGVCSDWYNTYWYQPTGKAYKENGITVYPTYELYSCMGDATGGYKAGIIKLTPSGLQDGQPCQDGLEKCNPATVKLTTAEQINKINFDAEIRADITYSDYGKTQQLEAPAEYWDIIDAIKQETTRTNGTAGDSKRLADIRQLASALELYFNDKSSYPSKLQDLTPNYIGIIPTAPTPPEGSCSNQDNEYSYNFISSNKYELTFCLGAPTGGYLAGKHKLSPMGIE